MSMKRSLLLVLSLLFFAFVGKGQVVRYSTLPEKTNYRIDSMVQRCIDGKVLPGCQVLAMRTSGEVVFEQYYGKLAYDSLSAVSASTMYDVASMTKPLATTLAVMKLYDEHQIQVTDRLDQYLDFTRGTAVGALTVAELMTHTSGLNAFIPFYRDISPKGVWDKNYLSSQRSDRFPVQAADHVFLRYDFPDTVLYRIARYPLSAKKYVYSDLGFILMKEVVEEISGMSMDSFLRIHYYEPLGLTHTGFNPRQWAGVDSIAPTEDDNYFRKQLLRGYVHDQSAAVFGGVCGNAGLFSTAREVAVLLQMLTNGGVYNGRRYLSAKTVLQFVSTCPMHGCSRRGLGFDTPSFVTPNAVLPSMAGNKTFGHQGFTGTVFWCDPQNDLIYIFLSNRVYPDANDNKLSKSRLRLLIHEEIYKGLGIATPKTK